MPLNRLTLGVATALGCSLALAPLTAATAAPAAPHAASTVAKHDVAADGVITGSSQEVFEGPGSPAILLTVTVDAPTTIAFRDSDGTVLAYRAAAPERPARYAFAPDGSREKTITASSTVKDDEVEFSVDLSGLPLPSADFDSTAQDLETVARAVRLGFTEHDLVLRGLPGATIEFGCNGQTQTAVADAQGKARFHVELKVGDNPLSFRQEINGLSSRERAYTWTIQGSGPITPAPAPFTVDQTDGAELDAPVFSGRGAEGGTVTVTEGGKTVASTEVGVGGRWATAAELAPGEHRLAFEYRAEANGPITTTVERTVTVTDSSTEAPVELTVDQQDGAELEQPTFTGTSQPGATVTVREGSKQLAEVAAGEDGRWTASVDGLASGTHRLSFSAKVSGAAETTVQRTVTIKDQTPAPAPTELTVDQEDGATIEKPMFTGTAPAGAVVSMSEGGRPLSAGAAGRDGKWSIDVPWLSEGEHRLTFTTQVDGKGQASVERTVTYKQQATPLTVDQEDGATVEKPVFTGTAPAGAVVKAYEDGRFLLANAAGRDGKWTIDVPWLSEGEHRLTFTTQVDGKGETSIERTVTYKQQATELTVDQEDGATIDKPVVTGTSVPGTIVIVSVPNSGTFAARTGADGKWSADVRLESGKATKLQFTAQADGNATTSFERTVTYKQQETPLTVDQEDGATIDKPVVTGISVPGTIVIVSVPNSGTFAARTGADGKWSADVRLESGKATKLQFTAQADGNATTSFERTVTYQENGAGGEGPGAGDGSGAGEGGAGGEGPGAGDGSGAGEGGAGGEDPGAGEGEQVAEPTVTVQSVNSLGNEAAVSFRAPAGAELTISGLGTEQTVTVGASGQATAVVSAPSTLKATYTVTAKIGDRTSEPVTFRASEGPYSANKLTVEATPRPGFSAATLQLHGIPTGIGGVQVLDADGKRLANGTILADGSGSIQLNGLAAGEYQLTVQTAHQRAGVSFTL